MKTDIKNILDLERFISGLTHPQKTRPFKVIQAGRENDLISVELTEEAFMVDSLNDEAGYESYFRKKYGDDFERSRFEILEPAETVIFYIG